MLLPTLSVGDIFHCKSVTHEENLVTLSVMWSGMTCTFNCWNASHHTSTVLSPYLVKLVTFIVIFVL